MKGETCLCRIFTRCLLVHVRRVPQVMDCLSLFRVLYLKGESVKSKLFGMRLLTALVLAMLFLSLGVQQSQAISISAQGASPVTVGRDYKHDVSPPLRDMKPVFTPPRAEHEANINPHINSAHQDQIDLVVQSSLAAAAMPSP